MPWLRHRFNRGQTEEIPDEAPTAPRADLAALRRGGFKVGSDAGFREAASSAVVAPVVVATVEEGADRPFRDLPRDQKRAAAEEYARLAGIAKEWEWTLREEEAERQRQEEEERLRVEAERNRVEAERRKARAERAERYTEERVLRPFREVLRHAAYASFLRAEAGLSPFIFITAPYSQDDTTRHAGEVAGLLGISVADPNVHGEEIRLPIFSVRPPDEEPER